MIKINKPTYDRALQQSLGASRVLETETMDAMSRSIQRLRGFTEQDFPPVLVTRELDLLENLLAKLRELVDTLNQPQPRG